MIKERLYKAKSLMNNETVYGYYFKGNNNDYYIMENKSDNPNKSIIHRIDPNTLEQSIRIHR